MIRRTYAKIITHFLFIYHKAPKRSLYVHFIYILMRGLYEIFLSISSVYIKLMQFSLLHDLIK